MEKKCAPWVYTLFGFYCACMLWLLFGRRMNPGLLPFPDYLQTHLNLIPFRTIHLFARLLVPPVRPYLVRIALRNLLGNIFLFTPLGFFLPTLFPQLRKSWLSLAAVLIIISCVELTQLVLMVGTCDIDDLLLNVLGAAIGCGLYKLSRRKRT